MTIVLDKELYNIVKLQADKIYQKPSAYKSMYIQKRYKELGGRYKDDHSEKPLSRWMNEKWSDVGNKNYPVYRPTIKVNKQKTPLTVNEIDKKNLKQQINLKQKIKGHKNLPPFQKK
jgi:hypothetical protein